MLDIVLIFVSSIDKQNGAYKRLSLLLFRNICFILLMASLLIVILKFLHGCMFVCFCVSCKLISSDVQPPTLLHFMSSQRMKWLQSQYNHGGVSTLTVIMSLGSVSISTTTALIYGISGGTFFLLVFLLVMMGLTNCDWNCYK